MSQIKITLPTNFNGKLNCDCFIHIDEAPREHVSESKLERTIVEITTADNSHPPVKTRVIDLIRIQLGAISTALSWQSHGMDGYHFVYKKLEENQKLTMDSPMAVYFYKKITE